MTRIGLFGKFGRPGVREIVERHAALLAKRFQVAAYDFDGELPGKLDIDLAVVFGGDGTILAAARYLAPKGIAAIGVNLGKFGFLAGCVAADCPALVDAVIEGRLTPIRRTMLAAAITAADRPAEELTALNDIVITASVPARMIGLKLSINDTPISSLEGDGLIVATATGSTGYNLSSGGPIVTPSEDVMIVNPLAPHTLSIRPMVVSGTDVVAVEVAARKGEASITADGQVSRLLSTGDTVKVRRAPYTFSLYEGPDWAFYRVIRSKLRWGEEPNYAKDNG